MKRLLFTYLALILGSGTLFLYSCTKDNLGDPDLGEGPDNPNESYEIGHFSFKFTESILSKADMEDDGSEYEQAIRNVWVLLYGAEAEEAPAFGGKRHLLKYAWNLDIKKDIGDSEYNGKDVAEDKGSAFGFVTKAKEVVKQNYKIVVIANPGFYSGEDNSGLHSLTHFTNGDYSSGDWDEYGKDTGTINIDAGEPWSVLEELQTAVCGDNRLGQLYADQHLHGYDDVDDKPAYFLMSNANGIVDITGRNIFDTPQKAEARPVIVNIDRAVAKIMVNMESEDTYKTRTGGVVTEFTWGVKNINKKSYIYRHFAPMFDILKSSNSFTGDMETGEIGNEGRIFKYATDPNFDREEQDPGDFWSEKPDSYREWNKFESSVLVESSYTYIPENTMEFDAQRSMEVRYGGKIYSEYATMISIRAYIAHRFPTNYLSDSYYSFGYYDTYGNMVYKVFTHRQAIKWLEEDAYPADMGPLRDLIMVSSFFPDGKDSPELDASRYTIDGVTRVIGDDEQDPMSGDIFFHPGGLNEYEVDITHFNFSYIPNLGPDESYGYLGVVRNNMYRVIIKSINGPGTPQDEGTYISAHVYVNPWYKRGQDEDI